MELVVRQTDETPSHFAFGSEVLVLLSAAETGGALGIFEERNTAPNGPPLHIHHDADETFEVIEGNFRFRWKDREIEAGPGAVVFIPRGTPHTFRFLGGGTGRFRCTMTPGGFEGFFPAVAGEGLKVPDDMPRIEELGRRHHLEFAGPPLEG